MCTKSSSFCFVFTEQENLSKTYDALLACLSEITTDREVAVCLCGHSLQIAVIERGTAAWLPGVVVSSTKEKPISFDELKEALVRFFWRILVKVWTDEAKMYGLPLTKELKEYLESAAEIEADYMVAELIQEGCASLLHLDVATSDGVTTVAVDGHAHGLRILPNGKVEPTTFDEVSTSP